MSSRIFQSVVLQMKDCSDRAVGVIDGQGTVVACNELACIGEKWGNAAALRMRENIRQKKHIRTGDMLNSTGMTDYLERLGGGGNKSSAGAAIPDITLREAVNRLFAAIDEYEATEH